MRVHWFTLGIVVLAQGVAGAQVAAPPQPPMPAGELVREVVYNELHDHQRHGYWRYWVEKHSRNGSTVEDQVETADGPIARLVVSNGHPLTPQAQQQEQARLQHLLISPDDQARLLRQYDDDEQRIGHILALLPNAFLYEYAGEENGSYRLKFRPNPGDPDHSIEARVFEGMSGTLWVNADAKRLMLLEGHFDHNVDFGFGILGRVYKGGWFRLRRIQVSPTDWKTESLEVHINVRALLVKTFARETSELRGGFVPVPEPKNLAQGLAVLDQPEPKAISPATSKNPPRAISKAASRNAIGSALVSPAALALRP
jgi:hypothetical protein